MLNESYSDLSFYGEKVVIFYEFIFGLYPYYKGYDENQPINGGLPQVKRSDTFLSKMLE